MSTEKHYVCDGCGKSEKISKGKDLTEDHKRFNGWVQCKSIWIGQPDGVPTVFTGDFCNFECFTKSLDPKKFTKEVGAESE